MRSFFGVREGDATTAKTTLRYMLVEGVPGKPDCNNNKKEEAKALAMQWTEKSCWDIAMDINMDLLGKPSPSSLGTFKPGMMVPAFDKVFFGKEDKVGEAIGLIQTVSLQFIMIYIHVTFFSSK
jgi:hypothetical protein